MKTLAILLVSVSACVVVDDVSTSDQEAIVGTCRLGRFVVPCPEPGPDAGVACDCDDPAMPRTCVDECSPPDAVVVDCCAWGPECFTCNVDVQECWPGDPAGSECPWWDAVSDAGGP